jgi:hypothetical protein
VRRKKGRREEGKKGWIFETVIFTMGHELAIPLRIREKLVAKLREGRLETVGRLKRPERQERIVRTVCYAH